MCFVKKKLFIYSYLIKEKIGLKIKEMNKKFKMKMKMKYKIMPICLKSYYIWFY